VKRELVAQPGGECFDKCETAGVSGIRFRDECADDMSDLRLGDAVRAVQLYLWTFGLTGYESIEVKGIDRNSRVTKVAIEADGDRFIGGTDPRRAAPQNDAPKIADLTFDFHGKRSIVEVEREVVMQPSDFVDRSNVIDPRLEAETRPGKLLGCDKVRNIAAEGYTPKGVGPMADVHLDELLFHV
jgi:hypothetical protein